MTRLEIHKKLHIVFALLIAFTLPYGKLTPLFIGLFFVNWLVEGGLITKFKAIIKNKLAVLFILFYVIHIVGLAYTNNMDSGLFDLEVKLSLFIFPLIISSKPFSKKEIHHILMAFVIGLIYASIYMLSRAASLYFMENDNAFFYKNFSVLLHSSYMSMYMVFAITWLILNIFRKDVKAQKIPNTISIALVLFFAIIIILISSKSGIISLLLVLLVTMIYYVFVRKKYLIGLVAGVSLVFMLLAAYSFMPQVKVRIDNFVEAITSKSEKETLDSTSIRMLIWESSNKIIKNNFIAGVGTGDVKDALNAEYEKYEIENALERNFNAHNEYYQVFIGLGVIGFLLLMINILYPLKMAFSIKDYLFMIFLLIVMFNFLSESMLETRAGVMFYAFFNSLLCFRKIENSSKSI